ncbi:hypothetical protein [Tellurirhabdus rosea]|uniref:hypothetical protein n=1 Tax=Tellurirhabdus rosea TaxID=2674997 RepID=UPI00225A3E70|nr:hypothetical protein [Tellurirhabdus rosea]
MKILQGKVWGGLLLLALAMTAPSCRQDTDDLILAASEAGLIPSVYQSISGRFPNATSIRGQRIDGDRWLVTFSEGSTARMSLLNNTGAYLDGETVVPNGSMPAVINNALMTALPGGAVQQLTVIQQNGLVTAWRINCRDSNAAAKTILISPAGTVLQ